MECGPAWCWLAAAALQAARAAYTFASSCAFTMFFLYLGDGNISTTNIIYQVLNLHDVLSTWATSVIIILLPSSLFIPDPFVAEPVANLGHRDAALPRKFFFHLKKVLLGVLCRLIIIIVFTSSVGYGFERFA